MSDQSHFLAKFRVKIIGIFSYVSSVIIDVVDNYKKM